MKRYFRIFYKTALWTLYLLISGKERQMYWGAKWRDREVLDVENNLFSSTYTLGRKLYGAEPERNFLTWKEFRQIHEF